LLRKVRIRTKSIETTKDILNIDSPHLLVWVEKTFNTSTESTTYSIKTDSIYK